MSEFTKVRDTREQTEVRYYRDGELIGHISLPVTYRSEPAEPMSDEEIADWSKE